RVLFRSLPCRQLRSPVYRRLEQAVRPAGCAGAPRSQSQRMPLFPVGLSEIRRGRSGPLSSFHSAQSARYKEDTEYALTYSYLIDFCAGEFFCYATNSTVKPTAQSVPQGNKSGEIRLLE